MVRRVSGGSETPAVGDGGTAGVRAADGEPAANVEAVNATADTANARAGAGRG